MYGEARPSKQSLVTDIAFEVFGLLMLYKDLLIVKLSVAIPMHTALSRNTPTHRVFYINWLSKDFSKYHDVICCCQIIQQLVVQLPYGAVLYGVVLLSYGTSFSYRNNIVGRCTSQF